MKYTFILQSKRYDAMQCTLFFSSLYCSSSLASVWCSPPSIVNCKWTLALALALTFALSSIFTRKKRFRIHQYQALMTFVSEIALVFFSPIFFLFFFFFFSCSFFDILHCILVAQLKLTKEKCQSWSILLGKCFHIGIGKKSGACLCAWISVSLYHIVNKNTIWHRLSFNLIWRFWLFIFSSCVNSTPV